MNLSGKIHFTKQYFLQALALMLLFPESGYFKQTQILFLCEYTDIFIFAEVESPK